MGLFLLLAFRHPSLLFLGMVFGFAYVRSEQIRPRAPAFHLEQVQAMVFVVDDFPVKKPASWSVQAKALGCWDGYSWVRGYGRYILYLSKTYAKPALGDVYVARVNLKDFAKPKFPAERDWGEYYRKKGIYGTAFMAQNQCRLLVKNSGAWRLHEKFHAWQESWAQLFTRYMSAGRNLEVAKAMLLGIRSSIDFETMSAYSYLGAIHILSVSGLHVGLLYVGLSFLLGFLMRRGKWGRFIFFTLMLLILWTYAGISGFSAPVLRSAWMFSVMLYASSFGKRHHSINTLAFSAFLMLLLDPSALVQPGFQLSYLAVLGLMLFQSKLVSWKTFQFSNQILQWLIKNTWELTCVAIAAQVLTWPLIIYYFHQFPNPLYFFLLNPFLILLSTIALGIGFLFLVLAPIFELFSWTLLNQGLGILLDSSFSLLHGLMLTTVGHFQAVIPFLQIHGVELGFYALFLFFAWIWYVTRWTTYIWLLAIIILMECIHRYSNDSIREGSWLGQYKGEMVWVSIKNHKSIFWAPQSMEADPSWIQNHLSPMWAQYGVRDTMSYYYPRNKNLTWTYHGREFRYLAYPCLKPSASVNQVIFKKGLKMHASWLRSWAKTNQVFLHKPSPYLIQKFNLNANYLDDGLALRY